MIARPARQDPPHPGVLTVALLAVVAPCIHALALGDSLGADSQDEDPWKALEAYIGSLTTGEPQTKRELAEESYTELRPLFEAHPGHDDEDVSGVVDSLLRFLRTEKDDWITTRVLDGIVFRDDDALLPLFLEALKSPSPNLTWFGIRWFSDNESAEALPELRKAWVHEQRPWVQVDLIAALARQGSRDHLDDFIELARGTDRLLSIAAIGALATLEDERAIRVLARISREGAEEARIASLRALTTWPEDQDALQAVLRASRRCEGALIRESATRSLASFPGPESEDRLIDLTRSTEDDRDVRAAAVEGMSRIAPDRAIAALVEILREPVPHESDYLHSQVIGELREIDDPSILEALQGFTPQGAGFPSKKLSDLQEYLARDRSTHSRTESFTLSCSFGSVITDPEDPDMITVAPPAWLRSIRCWEYPGVAGDPEEFTRLPAGTPVRIEDHFEVGAESWAGVISEERDYCWVPMRFIEHPRALPAGEEDTMLIRREFDVPASEAESDLARGLMDAGLLEVIEPGHDVIGVAITVDPGDFDMVFLLAKSCGLEETLLDDQIDEILEELAPLYPEHPVLDRFRRKPAVAPPETDTVIDFGMEEVSDQ